MSLPRSILSLCGVLAFGLMGCQRVVSEPTKPAAATAKDQTTAVPAPIKVTAVEGITEYQLANGLRVLLYPDASKPTVTTNITYLVGSRLDHYGETGRAHLLD